MKKNFLKVACAAMALAVGVTSAAACGSSGYTANNTEYYLGCSGPLSGGAAAYGEAVKNGATLAVEEINNAGGIDGVKINFQMYDDAHDQTKVAAGYAGQLEAGMQMSLGCVTTKPCLQYKALSKNDNVFFITPSATADAVTEFDNAHQMCFSDSSQGSAAAKYVKTSGKVAEDVQVGVFYKNDDDYSKGIYTQFMSEMGNSFNGKDIVVQSFDDDNATNFATQVDKLKGCKFIFMPIYYQPAALFIRTAMGKVAADTVYFGGDGLDGVDAELGSDFTSPSLTQGIYYISHFDAKATEGKAKAFIDAYKKKYGSNPIQFAASAYDCVYALYDAILFAKNTLKKDVPVTISASDMYAVLKEVFANAEFSVDGVTGTGMKWKADGTVDTSTKVVSDYEIKPVTATA